MKITKEVLSDALSEIENNIRAYPDKFIGNPKNKEGLELLSKLSEISIDKIKKGIVSEEEFVILIRAVQNHPSVLEKNKIAKEKADAYFNKGMDCSDLNQPEEAIKHYTKAIEVSADTPDHYYHHRGYEYIRLEQHDLAYKDWRMFAYQFGNDSNHDIWKELDQLNKTKSLYEELNRMKVSKERDLKEFEYWKNQFYLMNDEKHMNNAINKLDNFIKNSPQDDMLYLKRADFLRTVGVIFIEDKYIEKAIEDYNYVITLNPKNAEAYAERSYAYSYLSQDQKALKDLDKAIALAPKEEYIKQRDFLHTKNSQLAIFTQRIKRLKAEKENIENDINEIYTEAEKAGITIGDMK